MKWIIEMTAKLLSLLSIAAGRAAKELLRFIKDEN